MIKSDDAGSLNVTLADDVKSNRNVPGDEAKPQLLQKLKVNLAVWTPAQGEPIIDMLLVRQPILGPHFLTIITPEQKSVGLVFSFCCLFFFKYVALDVLFMGPALLSLHFSPLSPAYTVVPFCFMYFEWVSPEKFFLVMFLDMGEHSHGPLCS